MTDQSIITDLKTLLQKPLPGWEAQKALMPEGRQQLDELPQDLHPAAVLIALFPHELEWHFPLIKRSVDGFAHSGQIALPGGRQEGTESAAKTALREAQEEVNLTAGEIQILGKMSPLPIPVSRHLVQPIVGFINITPKLIPEPREVEKIFKVSLKNLKEAPIQYEKRTFRGREWNIPYFEIQEHKVWGATAMILSEFREIISKII